MYRNGTYDDCRQIYNLICDMESTELDYDKFSEIYKNQLNSESYYRLVRCAGDEVIGVINLRFERQLHQLRKDTHRFYLREGMHNFHYKFSLNLTGNDSAENAIGK